MKYNKLIKMSTKAQGLSINAIILFAIGLVVLVVFFVLFTSEAGDFSKTVTSCESKGGQCIEKGKCQYQTTTWSCSKKEIPECCFNPLSR